MSRSRPLRYRQDACTHWIDEEMVPQQVACPWGTCVLEICAECGEICGGWGSLTCPHDHGPRWFSPYAQGLNKPHPPIKVKGRHGGRIAAGGRTAAKTEKIMDRHIGHLLRPRDEPVILEDLIPLSDVLSAELGMAESPGPDLP